MAIYDIFSLRHKKPPDVFQYDDLPKKFRVQVTYIWREAIGDENSRVASEYWSSIAGRLAKELGKHRLVDYAGLTGWGQCVAFVMESPTEDALSLIEIAFRHLHDYLRIHPNPGTLTHPEDAVSELNARFKLHGIGYEFINGKIVRVDSQYVHATSVQPVLRLLKTNKFKGAEDHFLQAHEHFRGGKYEDAITCALKSLESAMKTICDARKIQYDPDKATAKQLIGKMFSAQVIPAFLESEFSGIRSVLESGLPTLRNRAGGHGQGATPRNIPEHFAAYALHMAASNILFLVECHLR